MNYDRSTGDIAGIIMQLDIVVHLIKHLSVLFVQIQSKLLPLCSFNFRCNSERRNCSTQYHETFTVAFKEGIIIRRVGWIEETTELRKV